MKNLRSLFFVFLLFLLICAGCNTTKNGLPEDTSISEFILGKWVATVQTTDNEDGPGQEIYHVNFVNTKLVLFGVESPEYGSKLALSYHLMDGDTYELINKRTGKVIWYINRDIDNLNICLGTRDNCISFQRDPSSFNLFNDLIGFDLWNYVE